MKKEVSQQGGTISSHWNPNDLTKKTSSKLNKDVINQKLHHSVYLICSVQIISTRIDWCLLKYPFPLVISMWVYLLLTSLLLNRVPFAHNYQLYLQVPKKSSCSLLRVSYTSGSLRIFCFANLHSTTNSLI